MVSGKEYPKFTDELLFPKIFQTFRMAIQPTKFILTFSALAVICLAGWLMDLNKTVVAVGQGGTELDVFMNNPEQLRDFIEVNKEFTEAKKGVFSTMWRFSATKFQGAVDSVFELNIPGVVQNIAAYIKAVGWAIRYHLIYCLIFAAIILAVISIAGGAICRISALHVARGEKPGLTEALRYSTKRFTSFFTAPLAPVTIIIFIGIFIFLLGLIGNIPRAGEIIVGLGMLLALFAGVLITVVVIGTIAGFNLMFPAIAFDGSDCFDAISRSFSYVYARPWRMLLYTSIAAVYGSICYTFVRFFTFLSLVITRWFLHLGLWAKNGTQEVNKLEAIWPEPEFMNLLGSSSVVTTNWTEKLAAFLVYIFLLAIIGLVVSFIINFYFSANTIIYSLMRKKVDNTAFEDIYTPSDEAEIEPIKPDIQAEPEPDSPQPDSESQQD